MLGGLLTLSGCSIAVGTPIIVAIAQVSSDGSYTGAILFASAMVITGSMSALYLRLLKSRQIFCLI